MERSTSIDRQRRVFGKRALALLLLVLLTACCTALFSVGKAEAMGTVIPSGSTIKYESTYGWGYYQGTSRQGDVVLNAYIEMNCTITNDVEGVTEEVYFNGNPTKTLNKGDTYATQGNYVVSVDPSTTGTNLYLREEVLPTSVDLDYTKRYIKLGDTDIVLHATVQPEEVDNKNVTWTSSDESVATVSSSGEITPVAPGEADITATTINDHKATCKVTVRKNIADAEIAPIPDQLWTGDPIKPEPTVTYEGKTLSFGGDYTTSYTPCTDPGTVTLTISGSGDFDGMKSITYNIVKDGPQPDPDKPVITDGDNGAWTQDSDEPLTFRGSGELADFVRLLVDGNEVPADSYTVTEGSTIVALTPAYLATLPAGKHTLTMEWTEGSADATFTIEASGEPVKPSPTSPDNGSQAKTAKTGDSTSALALGIAAVAAAATVAAGMSLRRKED